MMPEQLNQNQSPYKHIDVADPREVPSSVFQPLNRFMDRHAFTGNDRQAWSQLLSLAVLQMHGVQSPDNRSAVDVYQKELKQLRETKDSIDVAWSDFSAGIPRKQLEMFWIFVPDAIRRYQAAINEYKIQSSARPSGACVQGDPKWTDPERGVSGLWDKGWHSYWMDQDMNPKGLGYTQSNPNRD